MADQSIWPSVLDRLADQLNARGCPIFEMKNQGLSAPLTSSWYDASALRDYIDTHRESELADHRIFQNHSLAHDSVDIVPDCVLYDNLAEFRSRPNVRHVMQFGILHLAAALLSKDNPNISRFSVQFRSDRGGITANESAYGLTKAELSLTDAIAEGLTNAQIAERHGRAVATINGQVKSVLSKTGCATPTQFVRLLMSFGSDFLTEPDD